MTAPGVLRTVLEAQPIAGALRSGRYESPDVRPDLVDIRPVHRAFAPMVREQGYDVCELAIVTCLQAIAFGHPISALPVVVAGRFQRRCLISHRDRPVLDPRDLRGKRIGVRAYTQTTGMWVRHHLAEDFGVEAQDCDWLTQEGAHVPEFVDPAFVHPLQGPDLVQALRSGEVDAAILGNDLPEGDEFVPVIPGALSADRTWFSRKGYVPVNHVVAVSHAAVQEHPAAVRAIYDLLRRAESEAVPTVDPRPTIVGFDHFTAPLHEIIETCLAQGLLPRGLTADEVFGPVRELLAD